MRKFFIIFLTFIMVLGMFTVVTAENDICGKINFKLSEIEGNILENNIQQAKNNLAELRSYVYEWARQLTLENKYNEQVFRIIELAVIAIENNNIEYIAIAKQILDIDKINYNFEESDHS